DSGRAPTIYIENHDHKRFTLKAGGRAYWYLTQPYIIALFTCAGASLIYNGQEFGADNDMPDWGDGRVVPRPLDWPSAGVEPGLTLSQIYRRMIQIRKQHPGLRSLNFYPRYWDERWTQRDPH